MKRFQPMVELLDSRICPDAIPLGSGIVGPALEYQTIGDQAPPPGPNRGNHWATLEARAEARGAEAEAILTAPAQHSDIGLREGLQNLSSYLFAQASHERGAYQVAENRAALAAFGGFWNAAARYGAEADGHAIQADALSAQRLEVDYALLSDDAHLETQAQGLYVLWYGTLQSNVAAEQQANALARATRTHASIAAANVADSQAYAQALGFERLHNLLGGD